MSGAVSLASILQPGVGVLLVVNSTLDQPAEIERALDAIAATSGLERLSVIAPAALETQLLRRGVARSRLLPAKLHGVPVDLGFFLDSAEAVQWAVRQEAGFVMGSEPYAPRNEEVKGAFEQWAAPLLGSGRFIVHSLPDPRAFVLSVSDLWQRSKRETALAANTERVARAVEGLAEAWRSGAPDGGPALDALERDVEAPAAERVATDAAIRAAAATHTVLSRAARVAEPASLPRLLIDPPGAVLAGGWIPRALQTVRRPRYVAAGVKLRDGRFVFRGEVEGAYSALVVSRSVRLERGDAAVAEGRVFHGGITIGLQKNGVWSRRVDVDRPGRFVAAAVAPATGEYTIVAANCLKGGEPTNAVVLKRYGWARARG